MTSSNRNWKTYIDQLALAFESIEYNEVFNEDDYSQMNIKDKDGLFSLDLWTTSYGEQIHDVVVTYRYQNKEIGFTKHFEGALLNNETEIYFSDLLTPFLIEGWWIQKYIFVIWYKTKMKDMNRNHLIGSIAYHRLGLIIWILSLFDMLACRRWKYIEPLK